MTLRFRRLLLRIAERYMDDLLWILVPCFHRYYVDRYITVNDFSPRLCGLNGLFLFRDGRRYGLPLWIRRKSGEFRESCSGSLCLSKMRTHFVYPGSIVFGKDRRP